MNNTKWNEIFQAWGIYGRILAVSEYYPNYKEAFEYTGAVKYAKLGKALVYICDARGMTDTVRKMWEKTDHDLCIKKEEIPGEYYSFAK